MFSFLAGEHAAVAEGLVVAVARTVLVRGGGVSTRTACAFVLAIG
jgi:hypothetical protein